MKNGISVIIPTYNRAALVGRAIESVLAATSAEDEIIVVDDGSTDDTPSAVERFGDSIHYVRTANCGPGAARNLGIRLATRPFVAFLDSDDEWLPDKLELQRKVMEAFPSVVFCFGNLRCRHPDGKIVHNILSDWRIDPRVGYTDSPLHLREVLGRGVPFSGLGPLPKGRPDFNVYVGDMHAALMEVNYVSTNTIMVRSELAGAGFRFPEDVRLMEPWICFGRLAKQGPAAYLDTELYVQVRHPGARLTDADAIKQTTARISVLERVWGADERFLKTHAARYRAILKAQYVRRARLRIAMGQLNDAKEDLKVLGGPLAYRLLASLPLSLVRSIVGAWRKARRLPAQQT